ncbi:hypothetical protein A3A75_00030 [Candidatus Woesebacteria bacterium RIFCSPLOWO2_01_FULL_39_10]|uniref:DUF4352 domain-containing protein n=1 Tax=Candidatus Woesebacteria bacterium RIFCSPLOWO2_01_FULL_39_10 TaxID=1802516 RepID=A0A1F8B7D0_9BACT|nr:MAG: hypothetical protein A3A75_00030 [Candidatus Woesebacteria bacterium RIFCSPLOWO2_01_FULL_39_10]
MKYIIIFLVTLLAISWAVIVFLVKQQNFYISFGKSVSPTPTPTVVPIQTPTPTPTPPLIIKMELNKKFVIPLKDASGNVVAQVEYTLTDYEITNEIIVSGKKASAISGRKFLIINIKIDNPLDQTIEINTRNYLRLSVNKSNSWVAPDIHNDPVEIQPISTKLTRLGFPIKDTDKDFSLQIGELEGEKEIISF